MKATKTFIIGGVSGLGFAVASTVFSAPLELVKPHEVIAESHLPSAREAALETVARRYATFWNTGDEALAVRRWPIILSTRHRLKAANRDRKARFWHPAPSVPPFRI
ncbi:hypothetical protein LG58_4 [Kosakonia radicincitans YD4]|nr:hypothetical protein LG58_4 [Kosakonia radicincitans YD4]